MSTFYTFQHNKQTITIKGFMPDYGGYTYLIVGNTAKYSNSLRELLTSNFGFIYTLDLPQNMIDCMKPESYQTQERWDFIVKNKMYNCLD